MTLTPTQTEQLKRIGSGNLSEGIRRLLDRYNTLITLWGRNATLARNALATARHFEANTEPFEAKLQEAKDKLSELQSEYDIVSSIGPSV